MSRILLILASAFGAIGVIGGAFGAHRLRGMLSPDNMHVFDTGTKYLFYHALAIYAAIWLYSKTADSWALYGGWAFVAGIVLFSGSLFLLSTSGVTHISWSWLGPVTPVGGLAFIFGWICLVIVAFRSGGLADW